MHDLGFRIIFDLGNGEETNHQAYTKIRTVAKFSH